MSRETSAARARGSSASGTRPIVLQHRTSQYAIGSRSTASAEEAIPLNSSPEHRHGIRRASTAAAQKAAAVATDLVRIRSFTGGSPANTLQPVSVSHVSENLGNGQNQAINGVDLARVISNESGKYKSLTGVDTPSPDRTPTVASSAIFRSYSEGGRSSSANKKPDTDVARVEQLKRESRLRSHSQLTSYQPTESMPIGEHALIQLFATFEHLAERKVESIARTGLDQEKHVPLLDQSCGRGADADFDQIILCLSRIVSARPKPLLDRMMQWRQRHNEVTCYLVDQVGFRMANCSQSSRSPPRVRQVSR